MCQLQLAQRLRATSLPQPIVDLLAVVRETCYSTEANVETDLMSKFDTIGAALDTVPPSTQCLGEGSGAKFKSCRL